MPATRINGRTYEEIAVVASTSRPLPVDIQGATLSLDAAGVEIANDVGNPIPCSDAGSSLTVDGKAYRAAVTITRPSNTTAYTAGDVIGVADSGTPANAGSAIITLPSIGPSGGYVLLQSVRLMVGLSSVPSGMGAFRLHPRVHHRLAHERSLPALP